MKHNNHILSPLRTLMCQPVNMAVKWQQPGSRMTDFIINDVYLYKCSVFHTPDTDGAKSWLAVTELPLLEWVVYPGALEQFSSDKLPEVTNEIQMKSGLPIA